MGKVRFELPSMRVLLNILSNHTCRRASLPCTEAFLTAAEKCRTSLEKAAGLGAPLVANADMADLISAVEFSRQRYESCQKSKARKWLARLSSRVNLYGQILDVLVQHHPEYVSLAWGAFKFVFQVCPLAPLAQLSKSSRN